MREGGRRKGVFLGSSLGFDEPPEQRSPGRHPEIPETRPQQHKGFLLEHCPEPLATDIEELRKGAINNPELLGGWGD